jgi:hypothetical protein
LVQKRKQIWISLGYSPGWGHFQKGALEVTAESSPTFCESPHSPFGPLPIIKHEVNIIIIIKMPRLETLKRDLMLVQKRKKKKNSIRSL